MSGWHGLCQWSQLHLAAAGAAVCPWVGGCHLQWGTGGKWSLGAPHAEDPGHPFALQAAQKGTGVDLCPLGRCWPLTCPHTGAAAAAGPDRALSLLFPPSLPGRSTTSCRRW